MGTLCSPHEGSEPASRSPLWGQRVVLLLHLQCSCASSEWAEDGLQRTYVSGPSELFKDAIAPGLKRIVAN